MLQPQVIHNLNEQSNFFLSQPMRMSIANFALDGSSMKSR